MTYTTYTNILLHLKQFEGDGKMHEIEHLLPHLTFEQKKAIFKELEEEQLIKLQGREERYLSFLLEQNPITGKSKMIENPLNDTIKNTSQPPFKAKITFKGSKYLKEEIQMQEAGKYNINISGDSAKNTVVIGSNNVTINNSEQAKDKISEIIKAIKNDTSISEKLKKEAIENFEEIKIEVENSEEISSSSLKNALSLADQISSIGSLVVSLLSSIA